MSGLLFSSSFVPFSRFYFSSDLFEDSQPFRGLKASFGSSAHFCLFMKKVQDKLVFLVCLNHHQFTRQKTRSETNKQTNKQRCLSFWILAGAPHWYHHQRPSKLHWAGLGGQTGAAALNKHSEHPGASVPCSRAAGGKVPLQPPARLLMGSATWTRTRNPPEPELLTPEQLEQLGPGPLRPGWARFHTAAEPTQTYVKLTSLSPPRLEVDCLFFRR